MKQGFTLIELLVVVLIIGILSATALPQYQKAVWKSRTAQLFTTTKALGTAQEAFYMANGNYASAFSELDISLENLASKASIGNPMTSSSDAIRGNDDMEIIINKGSNFVGSRGQFRRGPYIGGGFAMMHKYNAALEGGFFCTEMVSHVSPNGKFCQKVMGIKTAPLTHEGIRFYNMR